VTGNIKIVQEPNEMVENTISCSEYGSRIGKNAEICPECGMGEVRKRS
jgi:hypothetical protein